MDAAERKIKDADPNLPNLLHALSSNNKEELDIEDAVGLVIDLFISGIDSVSYNFKLSSCNCTKSLEYHESKSMHMTSISISKWRNLLDLTYFLFSLQNVIEVESVRL